MKRRGGDWRKGRRGVCQFGNFSPFLPSLQSPPLPSGTCEQPRPILARDSRAFARHCDSNDVVIARRNFGCAFGFAAFGGAFGGAFGRRRTRRVGRFRRRNFDRIFRALAFWIVPRFADGERRGVRIFSTRIFDRQPFRAANLRVGRDGFGGFGFLDYVANRFFAAFLGAPRFDRGRLAYDRDLADSLGVGALAQAAIALDVRVKF